MIELHFPAGHEHPALLVMDLQIPDTQHGSRLLDNIDHLCPFTLQRIHDGLEHATVRIGSPDNDNFIHDFTPNGKGRRPPARPPPFAVLTILVSRQLSASRNFHH